MNNKFVLDENARDEWLKLVKKHKKRQKGLPALSTLNPNAGNVEHNINMFNMMNGSSTPTINPINGNTTSDGGCGECVAMGEALQPYPDKTVVLHYDDLNIDVVTRTYGGYSYEDPPDYDTAELSIEWDEEVDVDSIIEFLQDLPQVQQDLDPEDVLTIDEFQAEIEDNLDYYVQQNYTALLANFRGRAEDHATEDYYENDRYYESVEHKSEKLDDVFDLSMRTLL